MSGLNTKPGLSTSSRTLSVRVAASNTGPIGAGPSMFAGNLYLWLFCDGTGLGMAAMEADVVETRGGGAPTGFGVLNGFLNAGTATALLIMMIWVKW